MKPFVALGPQHQPLLVHLEHHRTSGLSADGRVASIHQRNRIKHPIDCGVVVIPLGLPLGIELQQQSITAVPPDDEPAIRCGFNGPSTFTFPCAKQPEPDSISAGIHLVDVDVATACASVAFVLAGGDESAILRGGEGQAALHAAIVVPAQKRPVDAPLSTDLYREDQGEKGQQQPHGAGLAGTVDRVSYRMNSTCRAS